MNRIKIIFISTVLSLLSTFTFGQDTIRLNQKPKVIIKSWYPEFKEFPDLKIGESKILFTKILGLNNSTIRNNDINLITSNDSIRIKETEKTNQYLVTVKPTDANSVEFELWFELTDKIILINQEGSWKDIRTLYRFEGNRILIDTIKLKIEK